MGTLQAESIRFLNRLVAVGGNFGYGETQPGGPLGDMEYVIPRDQFLVWQADAGPIVHELITGGWLEKHEAVQIVPDGAGVVIHDWSSNKQVGYAIKDPEVFQHIGMAVTPEMYLPAVTWQWDRVTLQEDGVPIKKRHGYLLDMSTAFSPSSSLTAMNADGVERTLPNDLKVERVEFSGNDDVERIFIPTDQADHPLLAALEKTTAMRGSPYKLLVHDSLKWRNGGTVPGYRESWTKHHTENKAGWTATTPAVAPSTAAPSVGATTRLPAAAAATPHQPADGDTTPLTQAGAPDATLAAMRDQMEELRQQLEAERAGHQRTLASAAQHRTQADAEVFNASQQAGALEDAVREYLNQHPEAAPELNRFIERAQRQRGVTAGAVSPP